MREMTELFLLFMHLTSSSAGAYRGQHPSDRKLGPGILVAAWREALGCPDTNMILPLVRGDPKGIDYLRLHITSTSLLLVSHSILL